MLSRLFLLALLITMIHQVGNAQRRDTVPMVKMYGVGNDEFLLSGYIATVSPRGVGDIWNFARSMGITTIQPGVSVEQIDTLVDSEFRDPRTGRIIIRGLSPIQDAGIGRELQFYPFDSAQSPYYVWKFTRLRGGHQGFNADEGGARERVYTASDDTRPGDLIASQIAYGWHPWQVNRFPLRNYDTTAQDVNGLIDWYLYRSEANRRAPTFYVAVTGHLLPGGSAPPNASVLRIELWYEIPRGMRYRDTTGALRTATENMEMLYATLNVPKDSLAPKGAPAGAYQRVSLPVNLYRGSAPAYGPLHPDNESRRLDLRVYWTGAEAVALRSVAIRDSIGELLLGEGPASDDYRNAILRSARRVLYGESGFGSLRRSIIRIMAGIEPHPTEYAGSAAVQDLLASRLRQGFTAEEAIAVHNEGGTSEPGLATFHHLNRSDAIYTEIGLAAAVDTSRRYGDDIHTAYRERCRLPVVQVPSIAGHNGGRFQIPLLRLTREGVEGEYEPVLQILRFGQYHPNGVAWPWNLGGVTNLSHGAQASRVTGRRMIATLFTTSELHLRIKERGDRLDTLMSHLPEASELRAMANLSLCYGALGIHYYWLGNYTNHMHRSWIDGETWVGVNDSWGSNGPLTSDTTLDLAGAFHLTDNVPTPEHPEGTPRVTIPRFYAGYGVRTREIRRLNGWLAQVGREMTKLRWRDSYSMHYTVPHPNIDAAQAAPRPLPAREIVREIRSASRAGTADARPATYVDLGLFEPKITLRNGARDTLRDLHHLFVVNRRCFERPDDVTPSSAEGRLMDSLAESRMLTIRFGLGSRDRWRHNIIRVREIAPDTTRLPLAGAPRMPLDTFIHSDSAVNLWLRPGGGALLEISYPLAVLRSAPEEGADVRLMIDDVRFAIRADDEHSPGCAPAGRSVERPCNAGRLGVQSNAPANGHRFFFLS